MSSLLVFVLAFMINLVSVAASSWQDPFLKVKLSDFAGRTSLSDAKFDPADVQGKWVLIELWASWCEPCQRSFPFYEKLYQENKSRGFLVLGLALDDDKAESLKFLSQRKVSFPIIFDEGNHFRKLWQVPSLPITIWINPQGEVVEVKKGFRKSDQSRIQQQLKGYLNPGREKK